MVRTHVDMIGEYYDNLDQVMDISEIHEPVNQEQLKKMIYYANAAL